MVYDIDAIRRPAAWPGLSGPLEAASDALVRVDERLARAEPVLADGARARAHLFDAQAALHLDGELVALEDLVLHEAAMDVRRPTLALARAVAVLTDRRRLAAASPGWAFSGAGWALLAGSGSGTVKDGDGGPAAREPEEAEEPAFAAIDRLLARTRRTLADYEAGAPAPCPATDDPLASWRRVLDETRDLPAVLAAAIALDGWLVLDPAPRRAITARSRRPPCCGPGARPRPICRPWRWACAMPERAGRGLSRSPTAWPASSGRSRPPPASWGATSTAWRWPAR